MTTQRLHSIFSDALDRMPRAVLGFLWERLPTLGLCPARPLHAYPVGCPIDWLDFEASKGVRQTSMPTQTVAESTTRSTLLLSYSGVSSPTRTYLKSTPFCRRVPEP